MNKSPEFELFATCLSGVEKLLAQELKALGAKRVRPLAGGVAFYADIQSIYRVCLWSRLVSRVMLVIKRIVACDADTLYANMRALPWENIIVPQACIAIRAQGTNEALRNTRFTAQKAKDALCDRLAEVRGQRPHVDLHDPDALVDVHLRGERATISLDLSGESLYRRSYLTPEDGEDASLRCALAAGLLVFAGWSAHVSLHTAFIDPVCGDGYTVVEAAAIACDRAPSLTRSQWGFFGWMYHDEGVWSILLEEADERFARGFERFNGSCVLAQASQDVIDRGSSNSEEISSAHSVTSDLKQGVSSAHIFSALPPDTQRIHILGTSASSPAIARARTHLKRAGLRQVASIERASLNELDALIKRTLAASAAVPQSCVIASIIIEQGQPNALTFAENGMFVRACLCAPAHVRSVLAGDSGFVGEYFSQGATTELRIGKGRIATSFKLFEGPPKEPVQIDVPSTCGGSVRTVAVHEQTSAQFVARLRKNYKERRRWAQRAQVSCYRLYDADLPDYAVALDVYQATKAAQGNFYIHVAEYAPPSDIDPEKARRRFEDVLTLVPIVLDVRSEHVFSKCRRRDKGGSQYGQTSRRSYVVPVEESGYVFEVDLSGYLDTGLFLDHRPTREFLGSLAAGKRFLNLFGYTGAATVHAAGGGAFETVTVDLSQTYLDWARRNMEANGFVGADHVFERADVLPWITETRRSSRRFDLIFVDPPTFSNSKAMGKRTWDVQRDHVELLIGVSRLLTEGGTAIFSCNLRTFKPDMQKLEHYGVLLEDITPLTIPHDFARNQKIHRCYLMRRS